MEQIRKPRKEFTMVAHIDMENPALPKIARTTIRDLFESLKESAYNSLIQEKLKKSGDGVCIRAWIVPLGKVSPDNT